MDIKAEVAGAVFEILAAAGDALEKDAPILILESMKMEIVVPAPMAGKLMHILVDVNDVVQAGQVLARIEP